MATVFENDDQLIEDAALSRAIDESIASPKVSREQVFELLETSN